MLCVDLTTWLQEDKRTQLGKSYKGVLQMTEEEETFEFHESLPESCRRNPKVWCGPLLNVHKNRQGELIVNFRRTVLEEKFDPCRYANEVYRELVDAQIALGV